MRKELLTDTLVYLIAFTYCTIFWGEKMGLNTLIFSTIMTVSLALRYGIKENVSFIVTAIGTMLTAILVVWHNSLVSKIIHIGSMFAMIGFAQQRVLRFLWYGFLLGLYSMLETPRKFVHRFNENFGTALRPAIVIRNFQLSVVPVIVVGLFYGIYYLANAQFALLSDQFWNNLVRYIIEYFPLERLLLFGVGGFIAGGALWQTNYQFFIKRQGLHKESLLRFSRKKRITFPVLGLKREHQQGIMLLMVLNLLLLIVNTIDINYVWFNFIPSSAAEMRQYVHEGTYLLIISILLAIGVLLYFFRGNLNFFTKNTWLKRLAYTWIAQNAILACSVAIRNYRYIEQYNLAYKRIGVFIFLTLVFIGLITLFIKVRDRKTMYFLLHRNAWIAYSIWLIVCCVNWDIFITEYNLKHSETAYLDKDFLIYDLSDKNLFLLLEDQNFTQDTYYKNKLEQKKNRFIEKHQEHSWLSWNYADHRNVKYLMRQ